MAKVWTPLLFVLTICQVYIVLGNVVDPQAVNANGPKYRLPNLAEPSRYDLSLEPDLEKFTFTGEVRIRIKVLQNTQTLTLNSKNLTIENKDVSLLPVGGKEPAKPINSKVTVQDELEFLVLDFDVALEKGKEYDLTIKYSGVLNDGKRGFYRSRYFDKDDKVRYVAVTHFEPTGARLAFPCWDEPAYKAVFKISLTHPSSYTAISNMPQEGKSEPAGKDKSTTKFTVSRKMSTYLVAFLVSDYGHVANKEETLRIWTKPQAVEQAKYALNVSEKVLQKLDEYTGIKYSQYMPKMDEATLKDFLPGAMENWGLVTYRERLLLAEDGVTTIRAKQNIATTIAHEFAHQWFGNIVSPKWWTYVWLNEGFADYFEYFIAHEVEPEWRLNETFVVDNTQGNAFVADAVKNVRAMNKDVDSPDEIKSLFDSIAYQKAGAVIRMMSHILTKEVFQAGLKKYLTSKSESTAEPADLFNSLQEAADKTWGDEKATFHNIMDEWVNKPGYPVVNVKNTEAGDYELSQEKFLLQGSANDTKWWVPITYVTESNADFKNTTPTAWLKPKDEKMTIKVEGKKGWVIFNTQQAGYYRVNYEKENWELLANYLQEKEIDSIHVLNRAQLIDDALNMARSNRLNYTVALKLTLYLKKEADYVPWQTTFRNLNFLQNMLRTSSHYDIFKLYVRYIMKQLTKEVGYEPKKDDKDLTKMLRSNVMKWACRAGDEKCVDYARGQLKTWLANSTQAPDVDLRNSIVCAGIRSENEDTWNKAFQLLNSTEDEDIRKGLLSALVCSESPVILKKYLLSTLESHSTVSFDTAVQAVVSEHPEGVDIALDVLTSEYEKIKNLDNGEDMIKTSVDIIGNGVVNKDQFVELSTLVVKKGLKSDLLQNTVTRASQNMDWLHSHRGVIEDWLVTHEQHFNSASSLALASFLVVFSIFITRFY